MPPRNRRMTETLKRERAEARRRWTELGKAPAGELLGVVRPRSVGGYGGIGGSPRGDTRWTVQIDLLAWRFEGGPVRRTRLVVAKRVSERTLDGLMDSVRDFSVVRMRARVPREQLAGRPQALMLTYQGLSRDREMAKVAAELRRPLRLKDDMLGSLTFDRGLEWFNGRTKWRGRGVGLTLVTEGGDARDSLRHARRLFRAAAQRRWGGLVERALLAEPYEWWRETWRLEGDPALSEERFLARLKLRTVIVSPGGGVEFWFADGDLFGGHDVVVRGEIDGGVRDCDLVG
jgi:hypothetical protein